jgi:nucleoside-diphosphate-sugar epimerase
MSLVITGATGTVGSYLSFRLMQSREPLLLLGRGPDFARRAKRRIEAWGEIPAGIQVRFQEWEGNPDSLELLVDNPTHLIHAAADTNLSHKEPVQTNLDLLESALDLCREWRIPRIDFLSTAYVCGTAVGPVPEVRHEFPVGFRNPYEESKWRCEERLCARTSRFPDVRVIHRPSLILPPIHQAKGNTPRAFVRLFEKLKFLSSRNPSNELSISIPPNTKIGFVSLIGFAEDFLEVLRMDLGRGTQIYHYSSRESPAITDWIDWVRETVPELRVRTRETCPMGSRVLGDLEPYLRGHFVFDQSNLERTLGMKPESQFPISEDFFRDLIHRLLETYGPQTAEVKRG